MKIIQGGYYTGDEGNDLVLRATKITTSNMVECEEYDRNGEFLGHDKVTVRYLQNWAKQRVKPKQTYRTFKEVAPRPKPPLPKAVEIPLGNLTTNPWANW